MATVDAAVLEQELADFVLIEITHKFEIRPREYISKTVTISVHKDESLFDILTDKVPAFGHWVFLDCSALGPAWRKYGSVPAEVIKPYVDDYLHTLFRIGKPTYQKIKLTHNDPRFWELFL